MTRPSRFPVQTWSGATWRLSRSCHQQSPRRRQIVRRHIIIEQALAGRGAVDALGDSECDVSAEHWPTAIASLAVRPFDGDPGRRAGPAAQVTWRRIVGQFDRGAAVTRCFPIMADEVAGPRAGDITPADQAA